MKKTFALTAPGRHPDRVLDAVKHEIRKYLRRERRRPLPAGVDFLDFDCRFGRDAGSAQTVPLSELIALVDAAARDGASHVYAEILAKPGHRTPRPRTDETLADETLADETLADAPPAPPSDGAVGNGHDDGAGTTTPAASPATNEH